MYSPPGNVPITGKKHREKGGFTRNGVHFHREKGRSPGKSCCRPFHSVSIRACTYAAVILSSKISENRMSIRCLPSCEHSNLREFVHAHRTLKHAIENEIAKEEFWKPSNVRAAHLTDVTNETFLCVDCKHSHLMV